MTCICFTKNDLCQLVGGLEHVLFFHILGIIIPTDNWQIFFPEGLKPPTSQCFFFLWVAFPRFNSKGVTLRVPILGSVHWSSCHSCCNHHVFRSICCIWVKLSCSLKHVQVVEYDFIWSFHIQTIHFASWFRSIYIYRYWPTWSVIYIYLYISLYISPKKGLDDPKKGTQEPNKKIQKLVNHW